MLTSVVEVPVYMLQLWHHVAHVSLLTINNAADNDCSMQPSMCITCTYTTSFNSARGPNLCLYASGKGAMSHTAGQEPEIVEGAVMYLKLSAPALWCYVMAECLKRYLLAQVWQILSTANASLI